MNRPRFYGAVSTGFAARGTVMVDAYVFDRLDCYRVIARKTLSSHGKTVPPVRDVERITATLKAEAQAWADAEAAQRLATVGS